MLVQSPSPLRNTICSAKEELTINYHHLSEPVGGSLGNLNLGLQSKEKMKKKQSIKNKGRRANPSPPEQGGFRKWGASQGKKRSAPSGRARGMIEKVITQAGKNVSKVIPIHSKVASPEMLVERAGDPPIVLTHVSHAVIPARYLNLFMLGSHRYMQGYSWSSHIPYNRTSQLSTEFIAKIVTDGGWLWVYGPPIASRGIEPVYTEQALNVISRHGKKETTIKPALGPHHLALWLTANYYNSVVCTTKWSMSETLPVMNAP